MFNKILAIIWSAIYLAMWGLAIQLLWNQCIVDIINANEITFLQGVGLKLLIYALSSHNKFENNEDSNYINLLRYFSPLGVILFCILVFFVNK